MLSTKNCARWLGGCTCPGDILHCIVFHHSQHPSLFSSGR